MALSQLSTLYSLWADTEVTFTYGGASKTPTVKTLAELPNAVSTADLPIRLLISSQSLGEGQSMEWVTIGSGPSGASFNLRWQIDDLLLLAPVGQTTGVRQTSTALIQYCGRYADMCRNNRHIRDATTGLDASVMDVQIVPGIYRYPDSDTAPAYFGVLSTVVFLERVA
jgi:hypothetical protein